MGILREVRAGRTCTLEPEHLIGRGPQCALRLSAQYVSGQHAAIRWNGRSWDLLDRGSRNGTRLNGLLIEPRCAYALEPGSIIAFGHADEQWELCDDSEPLVSVVPVDGGEPLLGADAVIGIPSHDDPQCTVYRDVDGQWRLERPDGENVAIGNGTTFSVGARLWRFCCPDSTAPTVAGERCPVPTRAVIQFAVSSDEEYVELSLQLGESIIALGARSHNYLLLLLARARIADRAAQIAESSCGWTCKEALASDLRMTPQQIEGEIFRIRKHFAQFGADQAAMVIERRARTKQVRIGFFEIVITKL